LDVIVRIPGVRRADFEYADSMFVAVLRGRDGSKFLCHLHDTGRLGRITPRGTPVYYVEVSGFRRFTRCDVVALADPGGLILVDSRLPNIVFSRLIPRVFESIGEHGDVVEEFEVRTPFMRYRADFLVVGHGREPVLVEVKGVNYAEKGIGLFPSAKSLRASKQLEILKFLRERGGFRVMVAFIALRGDITEIRPNAAVDPKFSYRLCSFRNTIEYRAFRVRGELRGSTIFVYYEKEIPVNPCNYNWKASPFHDEDERDIDSS
jgi:sugar fermentation stimulation protein A